MDVGSGFSGPTRRIARRTGYHVVGIDPAPAYVDEARTLTANAGLSGRRGGSGRGGGESGGFGFTKRPRERVGPARIRCASAVVSRPDRTDFSRGRP
ncbi:class I SAM-dependent methyltransferase [Spirillospora sp. NPDC052269]